MSTVVGLHSLAWAEPVERLLAAADPAGVEVVVPRPGQRVDPTAPDERSSAFDPWWQR